MPKKTLSDLILDFNGGFVKKTYEPAINLIKPMGKSTAKVRIADTQKKVDYKKEYEQLHYKQLYEEMRPHPKNIHRQKDFFELLKDSKDYNYDVNQYGDIDELIHGVGERYVPSARRESTHGFTSIPDVVSGDNPYYDELRRPLERPASVFSYATVPEEIIRKASRPSSRTQSHASYVPPSGIPQEAIIDFTPQAHTDDYDELYAEYEGNPSNFLALGRPKKQFLPSSAESGIEEVELFGNNPLYAKSEIEQVEQPALGAKHSRGKNPASAIGRAKGPAARKEKAAAKKAGLTPATAELLTGNGLIKRGAKRRLKRHSLLGGKISVGNLTKFFKSSYAGKKAPEKIDTYNLDKEITNKYATVYFDPEKNHAVITHKGTSGDTTLETIKDWGNNAAYAMGLYKYTDRYKQGKKLQEATEKKYGSQNVSTLGHSQGSKLARDLGQNSKEIINLNPAYMGEKPLKNEYNIRSSGDVVSVALAPTNRAHDTVIKAETHNPLKEHAIDILDRIEQDKMIGGKKRAYRRKTIY